jgi:hypothetical protein
MSILVEGGGAYIMLGEITSLQHELWNDTVESTSLVSEPILAGAQSAKIVGCLWNDIVEELEFDSACWVCRVSECQLMLNTSLEEEPYFRQL